MNDEIVKAEKEMNPDDHCVFSLWSANFRSVFGENL